ncbi:MAG: 30S ribosomal protein S9 [Anaerolineae bacterium SM23_84]|nr:MAG: 30S ribosomal protein S9 [Anaerolineae bacterium SM23_84]
MSATYFYGTGRRKSAVARVRLYPGTGDIVINDKPLEEYFVREADRIRVRSPLRATSALDQYMIMVKVRGGGVSGQAGAVRHGIARALLVANPDLRPLLRKGGFLTRDPRQKERKKPGLKRARKAPQYTKR